MPRAEHKLIINLAQKWQQKPIWLLASDLAKHTVESPGDDSGYLQYAQSFSELQNELATLDNLIRYNAPELLYLSPFVELLVDYKSLDIDQRIRDLRKLESSVRQIESATERDYSADETELPSTENDWVKRRTNFGETVEDQMAVLYKKDPRTAAMFSSEIAEVLGCTDQAVRKKSNKVWQMFKAEKEANKSKLVRRHTFKRTDVGGDE